MEVASPQGWRDNMELVLEFYNARRRQLKEVKPNAAHHAIVDLESTYDTIVVTQNVDNLHEVAGSSEVLHLHGELLKVRSETDESLVLPWHDDVHVGDMADDGGQLRPHIVWFGEAVPMIERAATACSTADIAIIIGTSMQVYPAAGLASCLPPHCELYYVDPRPTINYELQQASNLQVIEGTAGEEVPRLVQRLLATSR